MKQNGPQLKRFAELGLSNLEAAALDRTCTVIDIPARTVLCSQGTPGFQLIWVFAGTADVFRNSALIARAGVNDVIGEGTMLGVNDVCSADVIAATPMRIAVMSRSDWHDAAYRAPTLVRRLAEIANSRDREILDAA